MSGKTFLQMLKQINRMLNPAWDRAWGKGMTGPVSEYSSDWRNHFNNLMDAREAAFLVQQDKKKASQDFSRARSAWVNKCMEGPKPLIYYIDHCPQEWDTSAWVEEAAKLLPESLKEINVNPLDYTEHPNPYISEYAKKLINGED